jgi:uncharacterized membrane protein YraQ (UPF0718 family)
MNIVASHATGIVQASFSLLLDSGPYLLFGLLLAGVIYVSFPAEKIVRHLGKKSFGSVLKAALVGIPLPLCSCGVVPTGLSIKRQGASTGSTLSFMIATPQTGVDSISLTYALLDPLFTIFRPVAAFITAVFTGIGANLLLHEEKVQEAPAQNHCATCEGHGTEPVGAEAHDHGPGEKIIAMLRYAFIEFYGDIAKWLFAGIIIAGIVTHFIPEDFIQRHLSSGLSSMLIMLAVGIPIYICAAGSTPIAAALVLKGVSPGAALVFLLAGPATNAATMTLVARYLGRGALAIYLVCISVVAVAMGLVLDFLYGFFDIAAQAAVGKHAGMLPTPLKAASAAILVVLGLYAFLRARLPKKHTSPSTCEEQHADTCH